MKLKLRTTLPQFEAAQAALEKARKPFSKVSIRDRGSKSPKRSACL
jgi:hypothetical protein